MSPELQLVPLSYPSLALPAWSSFHGQFLLSASEDNKLFILLLHTPSNPDSLLHWFLVQGEDTADTDLGNTGLFSLLKSFSALTSYLKAFFASQ